MVKLGYVSRTGPRDNAHHVILGTQVCFCMPYHGIQPLPPIHTHTHTHSYTNTAMLWHGWLARVWRRMLLHACVTFVTNMASLVACTSPDLHSPISPSTHFPRLYFHLCFPSPDVQATRPGSTDVPQLGYMLGLCARTRAAADGAARGQVPAAEGTQQGFAPPLCRCVWVWSRVWFAVIEIKRAVHTRATPVYLQETDSAPAAFMVVRCIHSFMLTAPAC
jgi:hypothetical protein